MSEIDDLAQAVGGVGRAKPSKLRGRRQSLKNRAAKSRSHRKHVPITLPKISAS